jgi:hypothetical protein
MTRRLTPQRSALNMKSALFAYALHSQAEQDNGTHGDD